MAKPPKKASVEAEARLKAEATARIALTRESQILHTIRETIPADVTRAKAAAWLEIISPVRTVARFTADWIEGKHEAFRARREERLAKILTKTEERRTHALLLEQNIPDKFIVPFIERATLEDARSPLVDLWANLLASAADAFDDHHIHFINILSSLSPRQAGHFKNLLRGPTLMDLRMSLTDLASNCSAASVRTSLENHLIPAGKMTTEKFEQHIALYFNRVGASVFYLGYQTDSMPRTKEIELPNIVFKDARADHAILASLGLIEYAELANDRIRDCNIWTSYYYLTELGYLFAEACKILPEEL